MSMNVPGFADYVDLFSFGITSIVTAILVFGARESSIFNNVFTLINLGVISYVTITGLFRVDISNWRIDPDNVPLNQVNRSQVGDGGFFPFGFSGVLRGAGTCFYSFVGFDIIATTGEEVRNPQRAIPIAIIVCLSVCFVAYASVSAVLTLMIPYYAIPANAPLPYAFERVGWSVARYVIAVGAVCALTTSLMGSIFPLPRILYAMSSDGLLFRFFGRISKRFKTPVFGTLISGLLA
ncbi:high affinity cationic amino acid transporter 1 domain protein, partial [Opisthorchis viverrini]